MSALNPPPPTYGLIGTLFSRRVVLACWYAALASLPLSGNVYFERVHSVNVTGPLLGIQHLSPLMPPGSSIVNVGSSAALTAHYPVAYTASKWGLRGLSKTAALALGRLTSS